MANVYFASGDPAKAALTVTKALLKTDGVTLEKELPLKVHFGEKGNKTFIPAKTYDPLIGFLEKHSDLSFIETNVLYKGERMTRKSHVKLAKKHGFTRLPIQIADGERGESYAEVRIGKKHFSSCKIAEGFMKYKQLFVISHFKGHRLAGYGGAIKQLAMGCASRGGKLAQHLGSKPFIIPFLCRKCHACQKQCPVDAIRIGRWSRIVHRTCIGCGSCTAACPYSAIKLNYIRMAGNLLGNSFSERMAEYAYAAQLGKRNIYLSFAVSITPGCDCEGHDMAPSIPDIGVFASLDPVAIDRACLDKAKALGKRFRGEDALVYAEGLGLGSRKYVLIG